MDTSEKYIKMCYKGRKDMLPLWLGMTKLSKVGTFIQWRSFMGIIAPTNKDRDESGMMGFIPETLAIRTWCKNELDLTYIVAKNYWIEEKNECEWADDEGTALYRQDQLQDILYGPINTNAVCAMFEEVSDFGWTYPYTDNTGKTDGIDLISGEQLWLAFVMKEKFDKIWNDKTEEWEAVK